MNKDYYFISKPRCASTHIYEGLTNWDDKVNGGKPFYHLTASQMKFKFRNFDKKYSFSVIRHPYDLVVSWYNEHRKERYEKHVRNFYSCSFDKWLEKGCPTHWKHFNFNPLHQYLWLYKNDQLLVKYLIRMETFNKDIQTVYDKIKDHLVKEITIESISRTRKNESNNEIQLSESQKEIIYKLFEKDFKLFDYEK
jgi:hypothetical protein